MAIPHQHRFDLSDPALREKWGLRPELSETVLKPSQPRKTPPRDYTSRGQTQTAILAVLRAADCPLSRREIVRALGRSKCPYLLNVIAEMVALGLIIEHESAYRSFLMFVYEVV